MKISLITGSTLGGAEYLAEHLETLLQDQGFETEVFHGPSFDEVVNEKIWLVVTSTHGAGELPDNLKPLFEEIIQHSPNLSDVKFAVIGLGNSDYDTFCFAADKVEDVLKSQSAVNIFETLKIDVISVDDQEEFAEEWMKKFIAEL